MGCAYLTTQKVYMFTFDVKLEQLKRMTEQLKAQWELLGATKRPTDMSYLIDEGHEDDLEMVNHFL